MRLLPDAHTGAWAPVHNGYIGNKFPFHLGTIEGIIWQEMRSFFSLASVHNLLPSYHQF